MASNISPAKPARSRSRIRLALDLALQSRAQIEAELIEARERIADLESQLYFAEQCAEMHESLSYCLQEQLHAERASAPVPLIGMTREGNIQLIRGDE